MYLQVNNTLRMILLYTRLMKAEALVTDLPLVHSPWSRSLLRSFVNTDRYSVFSPAPAFLLNGTWSGLKAYEVYINCIVQGVPINMGIKWRLLCRLCLIFRNIMCSKTFLIKKIVSGFPKCGLLFCLPLKCTEILENLSRFQFIKNQ